MNNQFTFFWYTSSPFSQWHPSLFAVEENTFTSAEQYMMYNKAVLFGDFAVAEEIMSLNSLVLKNKDGSSEDYILKQYIEGKISKKQILSDKRLKKLWTESQTAIKALGKKVKNYDDTIWIENRERIVEEGNFAKFSQNADLEEALLATKGTTLVEASPYDTIWGIGLKEDDVRAKNVATWRGLNLLGKILTNIRDYRI